MTIDNKERIATAAWLAVAVIGGALLIAVGVLLAYTSAPQVIAWGAGFLGGVAIGGAIIIYQSYRRVR